MRITAVGTSGGLPTAEYGTSCIYIQLFGDEILLDCGEGSRQRLMRYESSLDVDAVFISHFYADHTLGLPGLVQALEMNGREKQLDIYVPTQRTERANDLIEGAYRWPSYPVAIHGYKSGEPAMRTEEYSIQPFETPYTDYSHGFKIEEAEKREFLVERAQELGVEPGPKYGKLQSGESIKTEDGDTVQPEDVLSDPISGRKVVYTGDTRPCDSVVEAATDASLLIYSAMFRNELAERAQSTGHSTAAEAGHVAAESECEKLWLTHISPRHEGDEQTLESQAKTEFQQEVTAVRDGYSTELTGN
jgi:Metal-dependent hydrolases of the beta-lactamase superfamily III